MTFSHLFNRFILRVWSHSPLLYWQQYFASTYELELSDHGNLSILSLYMIFEKPAGHMPFSWHSRYYIVFWSFTRLPLHVRLYCAKFFCQQLININTCMHYKGFSSHIKKRQVSPAKFTKFIFLNGYHLPADLPIACQYQSSPRASVSGWALHQMQAHRRYRLGSTYSYSFDAKRFCRIWRLPRDKMLCNTLRLTLPDISFARYIGSTCVIESVNHYPPDSSSFSYTPVL